MHSHKKPLVTITGPTSVGKTSFSIDLALNLQKDGISSTIINFDSLCFYKELLIGSARPQKNTMMNIPHELVGSYSIQHPINAFYFKEIACTIIDQLHTKSHIPILVGGSPFYIRALIKGMYNGISIPNDFKKNTREILNKNGIQYFYDYLEKNDPLSLINIHKHDHYRIIRAVEYHMFTKASIYKQKISLDNKQPYDFTKPINPSWNILNFFLDLPKDDHWKIIQKRTHGMINDGLIEETQNILNQGFSGREKPLQSVGYKEVQLFLKGELKSAEELEKRINISTRQIAKAQRTFFKKIIPVQKIHPKLYDVKSFINLLKNNL